MFSLHCGIIGGINNSYIFICFTENVDIEEAKSLFEANYSTVYFILYDTFVQAEANLRQRGNYFSFF